MSIYLLSLFILSPLCEVVDPPVCTVESISQTVDSIPPKESIKTARWFVEGKEVAKQEGVDLYYNYKTACWVFDDPKEAVFKFGEKARDGIAICVWNENNVR